MFPYRIYLWCSWFPFEGIVLCLILLRLARFLTHTTSYVLLLVCWHSLSLFHFNNGDFWDRVNVIHIFTMVMRRLPAVFSFLVTTDCCIYSSRYIFLLKTDAAFLMQLRCQFLSWAFFLDCAASGVNKIISGNPKKLLDVLKSNTFTCGVLQLTGNNMGLELMYSSFLRKLVNLDVLWPFICRPIN